MIYIVCGPTGSGKTEAAIKLADYFHCPIINADAFQIYKDMDIGTAKISKEDPYYQKHYLLDICSPKETYSVKQYQHDFREILDKLSKQYKDIIVCGGTGLYIRAAIYDYHFEDEELDSGEDLESLSNEELWNMLLELDKDATLNIHPNNRKRVIRAIIIARSHSEVKSEAIAKQEHKPIYNVRIMMIDPPRDKLYENINKRVDMMFENGLLDEVKELKEKYKLSLTSRQAIGYKEVLDYLDGQYGLEECKELIKKRSRNYAKRQVTFFKHQFETEKYENAQKLVDSVINKI